MERSMGDILSHIFLVIGIAFLTMIFSVFFQFGRVNSYQNDVNYAIQRFGYLSPEALKFLHDKSVKNYSGQFDVIEQKSDITPTYDGQTVNYCIKVNINSNLASNVLKTFGVKKFLPEYKAQTSDHKYAVDFIPIFTGEKEGSAVSQVRSLISDSGVSADGTVTSNVDPTQYASGDGQIGQCYSSLLKTSGYSNKLTSEYANSVKVSYLVPNDASVAYIYFKDYSSILEKFQWSYPYNYITTQPNVNNPRVFTELNYAGYNSILKTPRLYSDECANGVLNVTSHLNTSGTGYLEVDLSKAPSVDGSTGRILTITAPPSNYGTISFITDKGV